MKRIIRNFLLNAHKFFFKTHYLRLLGHLKPNILGLGKMGYGRKGDGTYILPSDLIENSTDFKLLSFGVKDDISFEKEFHYNYPMIPIYAFDPSIDYLPEKCDFISFHKIGLAGKRILTKRLYSFENILAKIKLNNKDNIILKIDIEGWEWGFLEKVIDMAVDIPVLAMELHFLPLTSKRETIFLPWMFFKKIKILEKMLRHYSIFHVHANNYEYLKFKDGMFPTYVELTFVNNNLLDKYVKREIKQFNSPTFPGKDDFQYPFFSIKK